MAEAMEILIADDDPDALKLLSINLASQGFSVVEATDGEAAWEMWQKSHFRLLITDWMMPKIDGPDLVRKIRAANSPSYTYIILLTALGAKNQVVKGLDAGADDYLTKPYYSEELLKRVAIGERILHLEEQLIESLQKMEFLAMHDNLTGLLNRRAIQGLAEAELSRAARESHSVGIALLDIDYFKHINDTYGHQVGDYALCQFSKILSQNIRPYDHAGRWGGEEFLILLPGANQEEAGRIAERVRRSLGETSFTLKDGKSISLNASIGVTSSKITTNGVTSALDELLQEADMALYRAKNEGRNRVSLYQEKKSLPLPLSSVR